MTRRIKLKIAYDGTAYVGWQVQENGIAIETVLNQALRKLCSEEISVIGASRTDSGVHADANVCVFDTETRIPADKFCFALNEFLPDDISVQESEEVPLTYHPRKVNSVKTYEYRILNRKLRLPKERNTAYFFYYPLDEEKMNRAAQVLVGEHDFKSFCSTRTSVEDTVRRIYAVSVTREGDILSVRISGNGFLYNMVRIIVGTLVKIGTGILPESAMGEILEKRDRAAAGPMAPAHGLTLKSIVEEKTLPPVITEENPHWAYEIDYRELPKAAVWIKACDTEDFETLLLRLTKKASRDGAVEIFVTDRTGMLKNGYVSQYFTYREIASDAERGTVFLTGDPRKAENA